MFLKLIVIGRIIDAKEGAMLLVPTYEHKRNASDARCAILDKRGSNKDALGRLLLRCKLLSVSV